MAEFVAIPTVINATINSINIVKTWIIELLALVREVQQAGETLQRMETECTAFRVDFELWAKMWEIDQDVSGRYLSMLWGPQMIQKLDRIQNQMATVKKLSKTAFQVVHQVQLQDDIILRRVLEEPQAKLLFTSVYESRLVSNALYQSCFRAKEEFGRSDLKLEIDVFRRSRDLESPAKTDTLQLRYQFLLALNCSLYELLVEGPFSLDVVAQSDFYQACLATMNQSQEFLRISEETDQNDLRRFSARAPPMPCRIAKRVISRSLCEDEGPYKSLVSLLYDLDVLIESEPIDRFPRSERFRFAFKIAEYGLFLSGTSWFVDLRSSNIRSARDSEYNRHFLLKTKAFEVGFNDSHFEQFATHAYTIGILLAEIGIGQHIGNILRHSNIMGYIFRLYQAGINLSSSSSDVPEPVVLRKLRINMGDKYTQVVKTCLESKESWRQAKGHPESERLKVYRKILAEYHSEVYSP
ncbi:hypothetical protein BKA67DRAFT_518632 [Truncatella angustata]|uniref:Uncharacterized protein n=1 Tax=Truncatella angustata TaxID=152316 RepID=A0A9P8UKH3_9PEZI|nr:uncharacterized protein BKA67DRAFT_518632 [Truncatella angustata]KAH6653645.1 hypothetical protein BKA67DRAFT_518632 [Truncatella angustata]